MLRVLSATACGLVIASAAVFSTSPAQPPSQPARGQAQGQAVPQAGRGRGPSPEALAAAGTRPPAVNKAEYDRWRTELSNWGRWGKDDQLGAMNMITPAKRKQAAAL